MNRWRQIESLFQEALRQPVGERDDWLREACAGDADLHREVASLLANHHDATGAEGWPAAAAQLIMKPVLLEPGQYLGPYQITSFIAAGGMGEVYRARDTTLKRDVALKVLPEAFARDPGRMARFQREAEVLASLNHPNIAHIYGVEERALVMELIEGETLSGPLPIGIAIQYARQIAEALEYAHERGVIHRDLKPSNIKVTTDGTIKLLDFGLAKATEDPATASEDPSNSPTVTLGATDVGVILGTAAYMSPEQASAKSVDKRADIWAFGVVLWEMLTGKRLFDGGETVSHTLADVLRAEIDFGKLPASTPPAIRQLLKRCLDRNVKTRLRDIGEARIVLTNPAASEPGPAVAARSRSRLVWILPTGLLLTALAALAFVHLRDQQPAERTLRYNIPAPENSALHSFAISPDGRMVAIAAAVKGRRRQLWLRSLEGLQTVAFDDTEEASYPFWSPDSRYIGFFTQSALKKVAASGGPAQTLAEVVQARGGTWGRDDVILASVGAGRLKRIDASGGSLVDAPPNKGALRYPAFLPDGRHFLYTNVATDSGGIYVGSLDNSETRRLFSDRSEAVFVLASGSRTGHLLFVRENTLVAAPFDWRNVQISGDVMPVTEGVRTSGANAGYAAISASDNGVLVYSTGDVGVAGLQAIWYDRAGKPLGPAESGIFSMPAISPDQKAVAFVRGLLGSPDIWIRDLVRSSTDTRFTSRGSANGMVNIAPVWSPRGERIAFTASLAGPFGALYQKAANASGQAELLLSAVNARSEQWSRDGRFIVFTRIDPKTLLDIWVLPIADGVAGKPWVFLQTESSESQGQLSPDSRWMAYTSDESGQREVYVRPFPSAEYRLKISTAGGEQPRWRGDGRELFYVAGDGKMNAVAFKATAGLKPSFVPDVPLTLFDPHIYASAAGSQDVFQYDVTTDGKRLLVMTPATAALDPPLTVWVNWSAALKKLTSPISK